jgi:hypothetical protein
MQMQMQRKEGKNERKKIKGEVGGRKQKDKVRNENE